MGKARNTRKYPTYPEIPEIPGNTQIYPKANKIPGNTRSYISTLLPDPNPTRYPVFCPIPDPTRPDIEKPYLLGKWALVLSGGSGESGGRALSSVECFTPGPPGREPIWHEVRILLGRDILRKGLKRAGAPFACSSVGFCCGCAQ